MTYQDEEACLPTYQLALTQNREQAQDGQKRAPLRMPLSSFFPSSGRKVKGRKEGRLCPDTDGIRLRTCLGKQAPQTDQTSASWAKNRTPLAVQALLVGKKTSPKLHLTLRSEALT